jgi:circadian clock protein KaiB
MTGLHDATMRALEQQLLDDAAVVVVLSLYVAGASDLSVRAIGHVTALCETFLTGRFQLEVIDVHRAIASTTSKHILVTPTLVKEFPLPERRVVGDMSNSARVLAILRVRGFEELGGGERTA